MTTNHRTSLLTRLGAALAVASCAFVGAPDSAQAQEILLTGPLAGSPAVRKIKMYREGRIELAPTVSFSLLDEYQRQIFVGARLNYNITDWLAIGGWGTFSPSVMHFPAQLSDEIQDVNEQREGTNELSETLTRNNIGNEFSDQLSRIDYVGAAQITVDPFRGKGAIFQNLYADTDLYFFGGAAAVGVTERADCVNAECDTGVFPIAKRTAIAPTFGVGFSFYANRWMAFGLEWRGLPFARSLAGFDNRGADPGERFPDRNVDETDRELKFNQMLSVSWGFYLPLDYKVSE